MVAWREAGGLDGSATGTATRLERWLRFGGWLAMVAVVSWPLVEAVRILAQPAHEVVFGDYALYELSSRQAWHVDQLLGPFAHAGFNHPGPAMFYLLAPAVRLLEPGPGLYLGAVLINAAALVAITVFLWRRNGPRVALWTAGVLNLFCLAVGLDTLRQPSNALLIIVPMALFVVLLAGAVTGVPGTWLWAAVVGSYQVQNHVTTAIYVLVMLSLAGAWSLATLARRPAPRPLPRPLPRLTSAWAHDQARLSGLVALALIWFPSTIELFVDHPNNFQRTWRFVHHGHNPGIGVPAALGIALRSIAISPFDHRVWTAPLSGSRVELVAAWIVVVAAVLLIWWLARRRQWFAFALACASLLAIPLATVTVSHAGGDNFAFLTAWLGFVPCALLLALGIALFDPRSIQDRRWRQSHPQSHPQRQTAGQTAGQTAVRLRAATAVLAAVAVGGAAVAVVSDLGERSLASISRQAAHATSFVTAAETAIRPGDHWIGFLIVTPNDWQVAAGVVLEVERLGYHTVVDTRFDYLFGKHRTVLHPVQVLFTFYMPSNLGPGQLTPGVPASTAGGTVMNSFRPGGPGGPGAPGG